MNLWNVGIRNLKKNFKLYKNYFLSVLLMLTLFNTVELFASDKIVVDSLAGSSRMKSMSSVILTLFMLFTIFYIIYFNKFFLKQRSNELGIYSMLGLSKDEICKILNSENIYSFLGAYILSIFTSTILYLLIKLCLIKGLSLNISWNLNSELKPYISTFILMLILLIIIMINNYFLINKMSIIELSEYNQHSEAMVKISTVKSVIGVLFLLIGYGLVLNLSKEDNSIWNKIGYSPMMLLTAFLIIVGTIYTIKNSIIFVIKYCINNPRIIFNEKNNIFLPQALFKLRTKSNLLSVISLLIAAIVGISSALFLSLSYQKYSLIQTVPSAIEINKKLTAKDISELKTIAKKNNGRQITVNVKKVKLMKGVQLSNDVETTNCQLMKLSEYNKLSKSQMKNFKNIELGKNQGVLYTVYSLKSKQDTILNNGEKLYLTFTNYSPIQVHGRIATIVISDKLFNKIDGNTSKIYTINGKNLRDSRQLYFDVKGMHVPFTSSYYVKKEVTKYNSPAFLMIGFIAVLLFISISCVMYFTTLTESLDMTEEFRILDLVGYSKNTLKSIAMKNNLLLFMPPLILGILNGIVIFLGYRYVLLSSTAIKMLGNISIIALPITLTVLIFSVIYGIIYWFSWKKVKKILF